MAFDPAPYRVHWPYLAQGILWLQHAGITPPSTRVIGAAQLAMETFAVDPLSYRRLWLDFTTGTRHKVARLLGCDEQQVALVKNTSQGLIMIAEGFPYGAGANVVTLAGEYEANRLPWRAAAARHEFEMRVVQPDADGRFPVDNIAARIDRDTAIVAVSWVQYLNGFRLDLQRLAEVCRAHGAFLVVDGVQGVGALPLNLDGVDAVAVGGHKWLCATEGAGFLYVAPRLLERLQSFNVSWHSVADSLSAAGSEIGTEAAVPPLKAGAERLEEGTPNSFGNIMLGEAVTMLHEVGLHTIEQHLFALQDRFFERVEPKGYRVASSRRPGERSGIIAIAHPQHSPADILDMLRRDRIVAIQRGANVRLAAHFYNSTEDMERAAAALA